jgi:hypothetical protein
MAYIVLTINLPNQTLQDCNNKVIGLESTDSILACGSLLRGIAGGNYPANVEVTTRSTDPAVATDGGLSAQQNNNHL